jgi:predicted hotdog family 3-hydroxylacyl-ACP dehydratase
MTWTGRPPAELLRHRTPALLLATIESFDGETIVCTSREIGPWRWPLVLEGAAQTAGLLAGLAGGLSNRAVIAEYRGVVVHAERADGPIHFAARLERRLLHFWRCRIAARGAGGIRLLDGHVTVAPPAEDA